MGATNTLPARFKIVSERFNQTKVYNYRGEWNFNNSLDYAINELAAMGFDIIGKAEGVNCMYILSDTFKAIK